MSEIDLGGEGRVCSQHDTRCRYLPSIVPIHYVKRDGTASPISSASDACRRTVPANCTHVGVPGLYRSVLGCVRRARVLCDSKCARARVFCSEDEPRFGCFVGRSFCISFDVIVTVKFVCP